MTEIEMNNKIIMLTHLTDHTFSTASGFPLSYLFLDKFIFRITRFFLVIDQSCWNRHQKKVIPN